METVALTAVPRVYTMGRPSSFCDGYMVLAVGDEVTDQQ